MYPCSPSSDCGSAQPDTHKDFLVPVLYHSDDFENKSWGRIADEHGITPADVVKMCEVRAGFLLALEEVRASSRNSMDQALLGRVRGRGHTLAKTTREFRAYRGISMNVWHYISYHALRIVCQHHRMPVPHRITSEAIWLEVTLMSMNPAHRHQFFTMHADKLRLEPVRIWGSRQKQLAGLSRLPVGDLLTIWVFTSVN